MANNMIIAHYFHITLQSKLMTFLHKRYNI